MTSAFPPCLNRSDWRTLYRAAILETDKNVLPKRVSEAEEAVRARGREIFYADGTLEEKEALEDALYALLAFRNAWQHSEAA
jgi:predicted RNA methylase